MYQLAGAWSELEYQLLVSKFIEGLAKNTAKKK